jgi:Family of unknown function (DUF5675)
MELELIRTYYPAGTNGKILMGNRLIVYSIELAWKDNLARVSCIPEGRYELVKRWSPKFNRHLQVLDVPWRDNILIHPANDASRELKGCIAPVSLIKSAGKGLGSRTALVILISLVYDSLDRQEQVFLIIKKDLYESC